MEPTRVAVIGCGRIAQAEHLPAYRAAAKRGLAELVGVYDLDLGRAQAAAAMAETRAYPSVTALLSDGRPEVVSITTQPSSHHALAIQALRAGCHVLCEKPIAMSLAEADEMVAVAERAGLSLGICFEYRTWAEAHYVRQRIAAGDLGSIQAIRTWGGAVNEFPTSPGFHRLATAGGGVLTHWTIHNIDLALWLLGGPEPVTATAVGHQRLDRRPGAAWARGSSGLDPTAVEPAIEDFAVGLIRLVGGTVVTVEANWLQPPSSRPEGWEILGQQGAAAISPLRLWLDRDGHWLDATPPPGHIAPCDYRMEPLIHGFLATVRTGAAPLITGPEIRRIQRLMDALYASMASGHEITLAP